MSADRSADYLVSLVRELTNLPHETALRGRRLNVTNLGALLFAPRRPSSSR